MKRLFLLFIAALIVASAQTATAQQNPNLDQGLTPYQSYHGGDIDSVALTSGNLVLHIPLVSYPQRGGKLRMDFEAVYNAKGWYAKYTSTINGIPRFKWIWGGGGVSVVKDQDFNKPKFNMLLAPAPLVAPDGSSHELNWIDSTGSPSRSVDGTGYEQVGSGAAFTVIDSSGVRYALSTGSGFQGAVLEDPNGNKITPSSTAWTDTLGRTIPKPPTPTAANLSGCPTGTVTASVWNLPAVSGGTATIKLCYANYSYSTHFNIPYYTEATGSASLMNAILLPNGTSWLFSYDAYLNLSQITFPTGGVIQYSWGQTYACSGGVTPTSFSVMTRKVFPTGSGTSYTWTYGGITSGVVTVSDPAGNDTVHTMTVLDGACTLYETQTQFYQGSKTAGTLLKTEQTAYTYESNPEGLDANTSGVMNVQPSSTTTIWPNGQQRRTTYAYDQSGTFFYQDLNAINHSGTISYGRQLSQSETDYGNGAPGPALKTTVNTYLWQTNSNYLTNNLLNTVSSTVVQDGAGTRRAEADFQYDQGTPVASGVTTQHDSAPPNGAYRGNLTTASHWRNTDGALLSSTSTFYDTGTVYQATDPGGHTTTFSYSGSFAGAYVTQTQDPLGHTVSGNYDFNTGLLTSFTDQNSKTSTYAYDNMWRFTTASFPDGGQVNFYYPDAVTVERQQKIDATRWTDLWVRFDGLGREIRRATANDEPSPYDQVDTCYDPRGLVGFKSYPYQGTGFNQAAVCSGAGDAFTYDGLKRVTQVTHSDGTSVTTSYTGRSTRVTDEGNGTRGVQRISQVDGLGRLASVCEVTGASLIGITGTPGSCNQDIAATGFLTTYSYDPSVGGTLGNLTGVTQGGLNPRSFTYDSLSELLSASNPEAGTTTYAYNNEGLLTGRTRPLPNQGNPATTVTATLGYDVGHRLTSETYSDGTPTVTISYDQTVALGVTLSNTIGRRSSEYTTALGGATLSGAVFSYDVMGRVVNNSQCTPQNCGTAVFPITYTYDYVGDLLSGTNGLGTTTSYSYNRAARVLTVTSSLSDANHPGTLFSGAHYNGFGALLSGSLGNGIAETRAYYGRGWLQSVSATLGANTVYSLGMSYTGDGDVLTANDSVNGNWSYGYDDFNRLTGSTKGSPATQSFTYGYDRFGNRWSQTATLGGGPSPSFSFDANNHINDTSTTYDAAGNTRTFNDGITTHTYTYDAENRMTAADTSSYVYDAEGRRVKKVVSGSGSEFLYDLGGHVVTEVSSAGVWSRGEVYAGGRQLAVYQGGTTYFAHGDWLGTQRVRTGVTGSVAESYQSLPFGDAMTPSTVGVSPNHFTGQERDGESGLDFFGARYYMSSLGRFMSTDPVNIKQWRLIDPQGLNLYGYSVNNPLIMKDPDGRDCEPCQKLWTALTNLIYVKQNVGVGAGTSGKVGGAGFKVSATAGTVTEKRSTPFSNAPSTVTTSAEVSLKGQVFALAGQLKNDLPAFNPSTGKVERSPGELSATAGIAATAEKGKASGDAGPQVFSTTKDIPLVAASASYNDSITVGAEIGIDAKELETVVQNTPGAVVGGLGAILDIFTGGIPGSAASDGAGSSSADGPTPFTAPNPK